MTSRLPLLRLVALEAAATLAVVVIAPHFGVANVTDRTWWSHATTIELSGALGWWAAAVLTAWTLATTAVGMAARTIPALRGLLALERVTAPFIRRVLDHALVVSLSVGAIAAAAAPASAATSTTTSPSSR